MASTALQIDALWAGLNDSDTGQSYSGAIVAFFESGTTTPKAVWLDSDKTLPTSEGLAQTALDSNGVAQVYGDGKYKINLYAPTDTGLTTPLYTFDGVEYISTIDPASIGYGTIDDMRSGTGGSEDGYTTTLLGYYTQGDGGGGDFFWDADSIEADDGVYIIKADDITTGRWKRLNVGSTIPPEALGIISGDSSEATATLNTENLVKWISPVVDGGNNDDTPISIAFSKDETYYFNGIVTIKSNVILDLGGGTLQFDYETVSGDESSACLYGTRLFTIKNGNIIANFADPSSIANSTNVIKGGNRGDSGTYFQDYWDSLLTESQGDFTIKDINITLTATGTGVPNAIQIIGGTRNTIVENIVIESDNAYIVGVYYEFGWATNEAAAEDRQTSHGYNMSFKNITMNSTDTTDSLETGALGIRGAYNAHVDGLYANEVGVVFDGSPGEAAFYNPWDPRDLVGAKANILLENIVGTANKVGLSLVGSVTAGYLSGVLSGDDQYALADYTVNNFAITGTSISTWGVQNTGRNVKLNNGVVKSFQRGIFASQPGPNSKMMLDNVNILGCRESGVDTVTTTGPYTLGGEIRNSHIAGNGRDGTDLEMAGVKLADVDGFLIENNQFSYNVENNQFYSVMIQPDTTNVIVRQNNTLDLKHTGVAYYYYTNAFSTINNIVLDSNFGVTTSTGWWDRRNEFSAAKPTEGTYVKSNAVKNASPAVGLPSGWVVVTSRITNLNGGELSGATSIDIDSGSTTANGDTIGVMLDDGTVHWSTILSGGGTTTVVINDALTDSAADGNLVFIHLFADMADLI